VRDEFIVLCYTLLGLFIVSFGVWLIFAWSGYGKRYATSAESWYKGGTRSVEVTLIRDDVENLGCASDAVVDGLHCEHLINQTVFAPGDTADAVQLRPYNTVDMNLFLGAGLWSSLGRTAALPAGRFTVVCNFHMVGVIKSVSLRFDRGGPFAPATKTLPAGILTDCGIPP